MTRWLINIREAGLPLLDALALRIPAAPRGFLRQLCKKRRVTVEGEAASAERIVHAGEPVAVTDSERWLDFVAQSHLPPAWLLYEDRECLVIDKPAGLAVHRALGHDDNLLRRIADFLRLRGETFRVAPIHRLDIGTSGAVLFGKGRASTSLLGKMIMAGQATKSYLALVGGEVPRSGELTSAVPAKGSSKEALTRFRPLQTAGPFTLLELELVTGRRHQIRRQLADAGVPIVGDTRYGGPGVAGLDRPFLHCLRLAFPQPATGSGVDVSAPVPMELQRLLQSLGIHPPPSAR